MPRLTQSPLVGRNFQVLIALQGPRGGSGKQHDLAVSHVVFPPFRLDGGRVTDDGDARDPDVARNLVLRRGHTGSPELFEWWRAERDGDRFRVREVTVQLLDDAHKPVTAWQFIGCHVVSLDYSPLDAIDQGVLMESIELSFKKVTQIDTRA